MSWFKLAERYVVAVEAQSRAWVANMQAQAKLAESHAQRNIQLADIDERNTRVAELRGLEERVAIDKIGEFMSGTVEHLARIETKLNCGAPPDTSGIGAESQEKSR